MKRVKIPGPPGTGKTHRLVHHYLNDEINNKKTPHEKILYVGFSNAAVNEARERTNKLFPGNEIQILTLHSLGKRTLNLDSNKLLKGKRWDEFKLAKSHNDIDFDNSTDEDNSTIAFKSDELKVIQYTKNKMEGRDDVYDNAFETGVQDEIDVHKTEQLFQDIEDYKADTGMYEFSDMIKKFIDDGCSLSLDAVFLDEAQDLNPLQWKMFFQIEETCQRSYVAGDDDQTIFSFTAASPQQFINLSGDIDAQINSNRVPSKIHAEAVSVLNNIENRLAKEWLPRSGDSGSVIEGTDLEELNLDSNKESWMILTRVNKQQDEIIRYLETANYYFFCPRAEIITKQVIAAWRIWDRLNKGASVSGDEAAILYQFCTVKNGQVERGFASGKTVSKLFTVTLEELKEHHGLLIEGDWTELDYTDTQKEHIQGLLDKGEDLYEDPKITVSTIHKAKGKEADNVILFTDMSWKPYTQACKTSELEDTEHRVWFVGITRAKKVLYYMDQGSKYIYKPGENIQ